MFKVKALMVGHYNHALIPEGKVFYIKHTKEFSFEWMKSLDSKLDKELKKSVDKGPIDKTVPVINPEPQDPIEEESEVEEEEPESSEESSSDDQDSEVL